MTLVRTRPGHAATYLVRAAVTAPSLYNTQPWAFVADTRDRILELHADRSRRLLLTGPYGRELIISCGAALFNVRLAVRHLGFAPVVDLFPRPADPTYLARVAWGVHSDPTPEEQYLYDALRRRHTVRGPFLPDPLPASLLDALLELARLEGATLRFLDDPVSRRHLAALVRTAESRHRTDRGHVTEQTRWTWRLAAARDDGVRADASVLHPDRTDLAGRDYAGLTDMFPTPPRRWPARTGAVAVLGTERDGRPDWLRTGQALQRVLLHAAAHGVMAAFHTQPLELPRLRADIRETIGAGQHPQMILRLGYVPYSRSTPRRPATEVLTTRAPRSA
jgi:nitroreductase